MTIQIEANVPVNFSITNDYCLNEAPDPLPMNSDEGIAGTWMPNIINTGMLGTSSYTFTPDEECYESYVLEVTINDCGCDNPATISINSIPEICEGETIDLMGILGGSASSIQWTTNGDGNFDDAFALSSIYTPGMADIVAGSVVLTASTDDPDGAGPCQEAVSEVNLTIKPIPASPMIANMTLYQNDISGDLDPTGENILWYNEAQVLLSGPPNIDSSFPGVSTFFISQTVDGCESEFTTFELVINNLPTINAGQDTSINCGMSSIILNAKSSLSESTSSINWSGPSILNGQGTFNPEVNEEGIYSITVISNETNCEATDEVFVGVNPDGLNVSLSFNDPICFEFNTGDIIIENITGGTEPYSIFLNGMEIDESALLNLPIDSYTLFIEDNNGCSFETVGMITAAQEWNINLTASSSIVSPNSMVSLSTSTDINEDDIAEIIWSPNDGLSCTDCLNPAVNITTSTTYEVTVIDEFGCTRSATVSIEVEGGSTFYFPNIISINSDNSNNGTFFVQTSDDSSIIVSELSIYDRWGNQVFQNLDFPPNNPSMGWDGTLNGTDVVAGVYVYVVRILDAAGNVSDFYGDLTVIR